MKLKNKLLPLTGFAAIATSVAPIILTSCNKEADPTLYYDISTGEAGWTWSKEKLSGQYTNAEMTTKYYELIQANPKCLAEDVVYEFLGSWNESTYTGYGKCWVNNIDSTNHTISIKTDIEMTEKDEETSTSIISFEITNVPYSAVYSTERNDSFEFKCSWDTTTILTATNWSINIKTCDIEEGVEEIEEYSANDSSSDEQKLTIYYAMTEMGIVDSHYMEDCTHAAE